MAIARQHRRRRSGHDEQDGRMPFAQAFLLVYIGIFSSKHHFAEASRKVPSSHATGNISSIPKTPRRCPKLPCSKRLNRSSGGSAERRNHLLLVWAASQALSIPAVGRLSRGRRAYASALDTIRMAPAQIKMIARRRVVVLRGICSTPHPGIQPSMLAGPYYAHPSRPRRIII